MAKRNLSPEGKSESGARGMMPRVTSISNIRAGAGNAAREMLSKAKMDAIASYKAPKFNEANPMIGSFKPIPKKFDFLKSSTFKSTYGSKPTPIGMSNFETWGLGVATGAALGVGGFTIAADRLKSKRKRAKAIKKASVKTRKGQSAGR